MTFYAFTSSDSGAPTLNGVNGSMINVLDWIIVTKGGGTKVHSGANKAIYQFAGGGMYLRVVHDSAVSGEARKVTIRGCESATGIDSFTDPFPTAAQLSDANAVVYASITSNSTARPYWGVVTNDFIVMIVQTSSNNQCLTWCFGKAVPALSSDVWSTVICLQPVNYSSYGLTSASATATQPSAFFARSVDGSIKSSVAITNTAGGSGLGNSTYGAAYPHPFDAKLHHAPVSLICWGSTNSAIGISAMPIRAWLPNVREPLHKATLINSGDTFTDTSYNASFVGKLFQNETVAGPWGIVEFSDTWSAP